MSAVKPAAAVEQVLVLGSGSIGTRHLQNAHALGVPELVLFRTGAGIPKGPLPDSVRTETELDQALAAGPSAVVVANPTALHVPSALAAARAGAHLLIEKPLSHSLDEVGALRAEVESRGLSAVVGYQFRFHPGLRQVKAWLDEGAVGPVVSADARWGEYLPGWQPWRDYRSSYSARRELGGGVLLTLSHPIDYLRWLVGEVVSVSATTAQRGGLELDVEDTALAHLMHDSGAVSSVSLDYVQRPPEHRLLVVGREGSIRWDNDSGLAHLETPDRREASTLPEDFERNHLFVSELEQFFACIAGREEPACSLEDGERALRICLAAQASAQQGQRIDV